MFVTQLISVVFLQLNCDFYVAQKYQKLHPSGQKPVCCSSVFLLNHKLRLPFKRTKENVLKVKIKTVKSVNMVLGILLKFNKSKQV